MKRRIRDCKDRLVSAVEAIEKARPEQLTFIHLLTKDVLDRTKHVRFGDQVNKRKFGTFAALTGVFAVALIVCLYISSLFFPVGVGEADCGLAAPRRKSMLSS